VVTSTDGTTWSNVGSKLSSIGATAGAIAYGNGTFVAGGSDFGTSAYSTDNGITWTKVTNSINTAINAIAYGNGTFVAGGYKYGKIAYSTDNGVTWTTVTNSALEGGEEILIAYGSNKFVAVATQYTNTNVNSRIAYLTDN